PSRAGRRRGRAGARRGARRRLRVARRRLRQPQPRAGVHAAHQPLVARLMRTLAAIWLKEWLALSRDVHGLAVLFVLPALFIVVMSLALADVFREGSGRPVEFAVFAADSNVALYLAYGIAGGSFKPVAAPASEA